MSKRMLDSHKYKDIVPQPTVPKEAEWEFDTVEYDVTSNPSPLEDIVIDIPAPPTLQISNLSRLTVCPRCRKPLVKAKSIEGGESTFFNECPSCGTLVNTFQPLPHQAEFLSHPARYKMAAGGFGSGKSAVDIQYVIKHMILIPKARVCVYARTYTAIESTFLKEFRQIFPESLFQSKNDTKHEYYFTNGAVLMIRSADDPTKLKSMNLTLALIIEASDLGEDGFTMLKSRIRNTAALIPEVDANGKPIVVWDAVQKVYVPKYKFDARHILMETNPASNWVKKFLTDSKEVRYFGSSKNEGYKMNPKPHDTQYTQVIPTDANPYLPPSYIPELCEGKSDAWIAQFIYGSFNFNDSLVYPNAGLCIVEPHELPRKFDEQGRRRLFFSTSLDYGITDPTHILFLAVSLDTKKLYVFDEYRTSNSDVPTLVKEYRRCVKQNGTDVDGLYTLPTFDGRSYNKRESDLKTIGSEFENQGLYFDPVFEGREVRIVRLNTLINHKQIEILSNCVYLIEEILNLQFVKDKEGNPTKVPKDGKDHGITALEFGAVRLPSNLQEFNLSSYLSTGEKIVHDKHNIPEVTKKEKLYNPLEEETYDSTNRFSSDNNYLAFGIDMYSGLEPGTYNEYAEGSLLQDGVSELQAYVLQQSRKRR